MQCYHVNLWVGNLEEGVKRNTFSPQGFPGFAHVWAFLVPREGGSKQSGLGPLRNGRRLADGGGGGLGSNLREKAVALLARELWRKQGGEPCGISLLVAP